MRDFKNEINGLDIKYEGHSVKDLTSTNIGIWNKGRDPIKRGDVAPKAPVEIHFREDIIGAPSIIFDKTPSAQISIKTERNKIVVDFDFLDFEDGAVIQVFHTSKLILDSNNKPDLIMLGDFDAQTKQTMEATKKINYHVDEDVKSDKNIEHFFVTGKIIGSQEGIRVEKEISSSSKELIVVAALLLILSSISFILFESVKNLREGNDLNLAENPLLLIMIAVFVGIQITFFALKLISERKITENPRVIDML